MNYAVPLRLQVRCMSQDNKSHLNAQLVKLGDMMGDGLHLEPGGKWISREYRLIAKALGLTVAPQRRSNSAAINEKMAERVKEVACQRCGAALKQVRAGSMRAECHNCGARYQLLKTVKRSAKVAV